MRRVSVREKTSSDISKIINIVKGTSRMVYF